MAERCDTCGQQTEYNGWPTYETWLVNLHLSNDQGTYNMVREMAVEAVEDEARGGRLALGSLMDRLKDMCDPNGDLGSELWPAMNNGMHTDLMGAALSRVDWRNIAEHWIEDVREDAVMDEA